MVETPKNPQKPPLPPKQVGAPPPVPPGKKPNDKDTKKADLIAPVPNTQNTILKYSAITLGVLFTLVTLYIWYVYYGPKWGTIHYGICKVFAERYVTYPTTMRIRDAEYFGNTVRVFVTHIDASGQYRYDQYICKFGAKNLQLVSVELNRKAVEKEIVDQFNLGIDAILINPPDLLLPRRLSSLTIDELWHGKY